MYWDKDCEIGEGEADKLFDDDYCENGPLYDDDAAHMAVRCKNAYIFACVYDIPQFEKDAIDRFYFEVENSLPSAALADTTEHVYDNDGPGSPLREVLIDGFCSTRFDTGETKKSLDDYPKELLIDVMFGNAHVFNTCDDEMPLLEVCVHDYHDCDNEMVGGKRKSCESRVKEARKWY
jgi:hypothetical protein